MFNPINIYLEVEYFYLLIMPNINIEGKIRDELLKSGYPLEVKCRRTFCEHNWAIDLCRFYLDSDNIEHEIDLIAFKQSISKIRKRERFFNSIVILECKKNESNHWIFFEEGIGLRSLNMLSNLRQQSAEKLQYLNAKALRSHHYSNFEPTTCYSMAFKTKVPNQIFGAFNQLYGAYKFETVTPESEMSKSDSSLLTWVNVYYPVIVLDGRLFLAKLINNKLEVKEVRQVLYFSHRPAHLKFPYSIDIITADALPDYLDMLHKDHEIIFSYIKSSSF